MAEDTPENQFALFRMYVNAPFYRRACVITFDSQTNDKYRLTQVNPRVCDTGFMGVIHRAMSAPQLPQRPISMHQGATTVREIGDPILPGSEDHFRTAVESIPDCLSTLPHREVI